MEYRSIKIAVVLVGLMLGGAADAGPKSEPPEPKPERERVDVAGVLAAGDGQYVVVLRTQGDPTRYLPIWIGEIEALNIRLRLQRQTPPRPLTLNLLESVMSSSNIEITEIAIDDLKGGVFLGTIALKQDSRSWRIDARPSDAIGLAVGHGAPIWVSSKVIQDAAVDPDDLESKEPDGSADKEKAAPTDYQETL